MVKGHQIHKQQLAVQVLVLILWWWLWLWLLLLFKVAHGVLLVMAATAWWQQPLASRTV